MLEILAEGAEGAAHADPAAFGFLTPPMVVSLAMLVVLIIMWRVGVPGLVAKGLDSHIDGIRKQLDEAARLRAEAEALRDEYLGKIAGAEKEAAKLMASAEHEAELIVKKAEADSKALVERRKRMAEDKIAAAERDAVEEVKAVAVGAAAQAARKLIAEKHDADADKKLADDVISSI